MANAYFRLFPLEWLGQVRVLSLEETGVYFTLTLMMLEREEPLPIDMKRTARALRTTPKTLATIVEALSDQGLIWETKGGFMSNFVQEELQRTEEIREKNSRAANKRWEKNQAKSTVGSYGRNANAMRTQSHTSPVQYSAEPALQAGDLPSSSSEVVGNGETRSDSASPAHNEDRCVYVGMTVDHSKRGLVVVEEMFPAKRSVRVRVEATGEIVDMPISNGVEFINPPTRSREGGDELPPNIDDDIPF